MKTRLFKYIENFTSKNWKFSNKKTLIFFTFLLKNIDCGYSLELPQHNEYPQSMFLSRNKKNNVYPCKPQFYYKKIGFKGVKTIKACFHDVRVTDEIKLVFCRTLVEVESPKHYITGCALYENVYDI